MTDCTEIPTLTDIEESKSAMDDIQLFTYSGADSFVDFKGVTRDTVTGRIKQMGYTVPIPYELGIIFGTNDNVKTVEQSSVIYAPLPSSLPFTTSGTFIGDDDARFFVIQGLTEQQADSKYTTPTQVDDQVDQRSVRAFKTVVLMQAGLGFSIDQPLKVQGENNEVTNYIVVGSSSDVDLGGGLWAKKLISNNVGFASVSPCNNIVFDMQRDAMKSQGAISGEPLTTVEWIVTGSEIKGSNTISVGINSAVAGQLIGYYADDDEYYTSRVKTPGTTLTLYDALEADVSINKVVFSFFKDKSHPSANGYRAIVDYMLRQHVYQKITNDIGSLVYSKVGGTEVIDTLSTDVFANCGSSEYPSVRMQTTIQNDGFIASDVRLSNGDSSIELMINTNGANIRIRVAMNDETATFIYDEIINTELPTKITIPIRKKLDASMIIRMQQNDVGAADINFIMKFLVGSSVKIDSLNGGVHVLHGDSWMSQEGIFERLQERLPNANIINNGVGGRTSFNLADTVYSEVEQYNPDYVWCIAGTNDAVLGVSSSDYHKWMNQLIVNLKDIGATPVMFTPAVGNLIDGWLDRSKAYMYRYDFRDGEITEYENVLISFAGVAIAATSNVLCGTAGRTRDTVKVLEAFGSGVNNMDFGYSTGMSNPTIDVDTKAGNSILNGFTVTKADDNEYYFNISCENTTGSPQTASGFARVRIKNSRN